ncbi:hypothetical protein ABMA75_03085 [Halobacteriovorax sp. ZH4_bin.1]|uniref:hypothetical protein n=1 Tax=unclassified Halobacteriovorax TaxID=2639665 RepID=UPI00371259C3
MKAQLLIFLVSFSTLALEVDSFTHRDEAISKEDALAQVNKYVNNKISSAVAEANHADRIFGQRCSNYTIRRKIKKKFVASLKGIFVTAPIQRYIDKGKIGKEYLVKTRKKESIYRYIPLIYKPILNLTPYSPLLKVNDALIGSDKFSHMFNLGYLYFRKMEHGLSIKEILRYGKNSERIMWGGFFNGIVSNGDLVANFQGMRFYQHLFGKGIDPLTNDDLEGDGIIKCINGKFQVVAEIDMAEFVDDGMDEGINCNSYTSNFMRKNIKKAMDKIPMSCPVEVDQCEALGEKYSHLSKYLLYSECR